VKTLRGPRNTVLDGSLDPPTAKRCSLHQITLASCCTSIKCASCMCVYADARLDRTSLVNCSCTSQTPTSIIPIHRSTTKSPTTHYPYSVLPLHGHVPTGLRPSVTPLQSSNQHCRAQLPRLHSSCSLTEKSPICRAARVLRDRDRVTATSRRSGSSHTAA